MAEILVAASAEMAEAAAWYDDRVAGLGERFLLEAEAAFARINEKPLTGPPWKHRRLPEGVRRMFVRSFPYSAVDIVEPRVVVVALVHARRRPGYWVKRLSDSEATSFANGSGTGERPQPALGTVADS